MNLNKISKDAALKKLEEIETYLSAYINSTCSDEHMNEIRNFVSESTLLRAASLLKTTLDSVVIIKTTLTRLLDTTIECEYIRKQYLENVRQYRVSLEIEQSKISSVINKIRNDMEDINFDQLSMLVTALSLMKDSEGLQLTMNINKKESLPDFMLGAI